MKMHRAYLQKLQSAAPPARRTPRGVRNRGVALIVLLLVAQLLAGCGGAPKLEGTLYNPIIPAPEITGVNWDGSTFRLSDLQEKVTLIFFGYTFCPDICPTTLGTMKRVRAELGARADDVAVVFISLDPARDTPDRIGVYISAFDDAFYGVHLDEATLAQAKTDYGVYGEKRVLDDSESSADYFIDHTGWIYVVDKQGQLREVFNHDADAEVVASDVRALLRRS